MAQTFLVLARRDSLPPLTALAPLLAGAELPAVVDAAWSLESDSGWLPMTWRGTASGCEVELEKLSRKDAAAAKAAGFAGCNVAIAITSRGWESLQCAVCLGAALAVAASGCISEDEDEYIGPDSALDWAQETVLATDRQRRMDQERDAAVAAAQASGDAGSGLGAALASLEGCAVAEFRSMLMSHLGVVLPDRRHIAGSAWRVRAADGTEHANDRHAALRTRQARLMSMPDSDRHRKEIAALDRQLAKAAKQDAQGSASGIAEVERWPAEVRVTSARWTAPNVVTVAFDIGTSITFTGGLFGEVTCGFPPLRYRVTDEGPSLA